MTVKEKIEAACASVEGETNFDILAEMKAALNSVYGEDRNQIAKPTYESVMKRAKEIGVQDAITRAIEVMGADRVTSYLRTGINDSLSYQIIIHFPEITIKNDTRQHLIRDIYVRLFLRPNGLLGAYMQGMRTTVTEAEFISQYVHSHLPRLQSNSIIFHNFCTGIGEINQVLAVLNTKYTVANFMMLLMHIKNFLEWESKEGHPYMFMENVFARSSNMTIHNTLPDYLASGAASVLIEDIRRDMNIVEIMKMFNFTVTERSITAASTVELEKWMAAKIERWNILDMFRTSYSNNSFLSLRDNAGNYHAMPEAGIRINYERGSILNFKGRDIEFQVIERSQTQVHETFANPKITKEACKKLSRKLTKVALTTAGIKSGSALIYSTRTSEPDKVSV